VIFRDDLEVRINVLRGGQTLQIIGGGKLNGLCRKEKKKRSSQVSAVRNRLVLAGKRISTRQPGDRKRLPGACLLIW